MQKSMSWLEKFEKDLGKKDIPNIVWDDSSSDDEIFSFNCKRRKTCKIPSTRSACSITDTIIRESASCDSSPIIGWNSFHSCTISPEITHRVFEREVSPVIEKRYIRLKRHKRMKAQLKENTPYLIELGTQFIETSSPNTRPYSQAIPMIEHFPSQFGSEVIPRNIELHNDLYYHPVKKRKRLNKNSLAYYVHKTLRSKINSIKFWYHDKVNRPSRTEIKDDFDLEVQIINIDKEYGNVLLECKILNCNFKMDLEDHSQNVLINSGVTSILNICWEKESIYRFYLPFTMEKVFHEDKHLLYICNLSKVIKKNS